MAGTDIRIWILVSLCVREWIETMIFHPEIRPDLVSLCVREWIETIRVWKFIFDQNRLPLREGVD